MSEKFISLSDESFEKINMHYREIKSITDDGEKNNRFQRFYSRILFLFTP